MGGRSLRSTAELVYEGSVDPFVRVQRTNDEEEEETGGVRMGIRGGDRGNAGWVVKFLEKVGPSVERMGGVHVWRAHLRFILQRSILA